MTNILGTQIRHDLIHDITAIFCNIDGLPKRIGIKLRGI